MPQIKTRILIAVGICLACLVIGTVLQFQLLPTDVWTSSTSFVQSVEGPNGYHSFIRCTVLQNHIVEGYQAEIRVVFDIRPTALAPEQKDARLAEDGVTAIMIVTPKHAGAETASLRVAFPNLQLTTLNISYEVSPSNWHRLWLVVVISLPLIALAFVVYFGARARQIKMRSLEVKIEAAEVKADNATDKTKPSWDLARVTLEAYFDKNLFQVSQVFWFAVIVMCVGFAFVLAGVVMALNHPEAIEPPLVAALSGIITQFIGATFLVIYKSTMAQANEFMSVLERINTVGMAVQVLDSIPDSAVALKNKTRAQIVELLLSAKVHSKTAQKPQKKKKAKPDG
jgi:hypothetical protein